MTFIPPQNNIMCDCLQPGCSYCDQDGSITRSRDEFLIRAIKGLELDKQKRKERELIKIPEPPPGFFEKMLEKLNKKLFG